MDQPHFAVLHDLFDVGQPSRTRIALLTSARPFASSMFAPGVPQVMKEFGTDNIDLASFVVSVYVLGYAFGPLVIAPLSEVYGRLPIYLASSVLFLLFNMGCALSANIGVLTAFRFLAGLAGSCPITVGSGTIADTFKQEERGKIMGLWQFSVLFGPRCVIMPLLDESRAGTNGKLIAWGP